MSAVTDVELERAESPVRRLWREYARSRSALASLALLLTVVALALLAPWVSPQNPYDLAQLDILDAKLPPGEASATGGRFLLGSTAIMLFGAGMMEWQMDLSNGPGVQMGQQVGRLRSL